MKTVILGILLIPAIILLRPSLAQSSEVEAVPESALHAKTLYIPSAVYKGSLSMRQEAGSPEAVADFNGKINDSPKVKIFRVEKLIVTGSSSNVFMDDDRISFTAKAPMPRVDGMLSLASTVYQAPLDGEKTRLVQALSLLATRQINTEFAYSIRVNKSSSFDSAIFCSLRPGSTNVAARVQYSISF